MRHIASAVLTMMLMGCATAVPTTAPAQRTPDMSANELKQLESSKWDSSLPANREAFMRLFADDFESVEYGTDVQGGVHRRTRADVFSGPPLPPARFELSDWHFIHADTDVVIVSYRVKGLSFPWQAYATSVWAYRDGRWQTVFYQASTAAEE